MRISKIKLEKKYTEQKGLNEIDLTKKNLGSVVALIGKNGTGKSRILKIVEEYITLNITYKEIENGNISKISDKKNSPYKNEIEKLQEQFNLLNRTNINKIKSVEIENQIKTLKSQNEKYFLEKVRSSIKVVNLEEVNKIKDQLTLKTLNDKEITFEDILNNSYLNKSKAGNFNEFSELFTENTINYFEKISSETIKERIDLYLDYPDNLEKINEEIKTKKSNQLFISFQSYVRQFLGKEFTYKQNKNKDFKSVLYFDNIPFKTSLLSPGQQILLLMLFCFFF